MQPLVHRQPAAAADATTPGATPMSADRTQHVLDSIDGALADDEWPDAMRWAPEPEEVAAPAPYDGRHVPLPPQQYERPRSYVEQWVGDYDRDHSRTPLAELEEVGRRILASGHPPRVVVRGQAADELIVDDDGGLTPGWVAAQRRPMARPPVSQHWSGLTICDDPAPRSPHLPGGVALDLNVNPGGWPALTLRLLEDAERRSREQQEAREAFMRAFEGIAEALRPAFDTMRELAQQMGTSMGDLVRLIESAKTRPLAPLRPEPGLRESDPRQYALELRQSRNTGPSRPNAQTARRPRRHQQ